MFRELFPVNRTDYAALDVLDVGTFHKGALEQLKNTE